MSWLLPLFGVGVAHPHSPVAPSLHVNIPLLTIYQFSLLSYTRVNSLLLSLIVICTPYAVFVHVLYTLASRCADVLRSTSQPAFTSSLTVAHQRRLRRTF